MQTNAPSKPAEAQSFLTDELAAMRRDAERYRWLRANLKKDGDDYEAFMSTRGLFKSDDEWPKDIDAAIDGAMLAN